MLFLLAQIEYFPRHEWLSTSVLPLLACLGTLANYSLRNSKIYHVIHPFRLKTCLQKRGSLPRHSSSFLPVSSQLSGDAGAHFCSPSESTTLLGSAAVHRGFTALAARSCSPARQPPGGTASLSSWLIPTPGSPPTSETMM